MHFGFMYFGLMNVIILHPRNQSTLVGLLKYFMPLINARIMEEIELVERSIDHLTPNDL
jgi:hypothetical protein